VNEYGHWGSTGLAVDIILYTRAATLVEAWVDELLVTPHQSGPSTPNFP